MEAKPGTYIVNAFGKLRIFVFSLYLTLVCKECNSRITLGPNTVGARSRSGGVKVITWHPPPPGAYGMGDRLRLLCPFFFLHEGFHPSHPGFGL